MEISSEYFKKEHFLAKIDARVKLVSTFALLVMVLSYKGILFPLLVATICFLLCLKMGIPLRVLILRMAQPLFFVIVISLLKFFFSGQEALFSANLLGLNVVGHKDGLVEGFRISSRIAGGVFLVMTFGFATPFTEIIGGLSWLRIPKPFIEIMMFAYRYIFVFLEDGLTIYSAQKNRLGYAGIRRGLASFGTLAGSLVIRGFAHSQKTSEAMELRGYTGDLPLMKHKPLNLGEVAAAVAVVLIGGAVWML